LHADFSAELSQISHYYRGKAISDAIGYAKFYSRSHNAVIRVHDEAGNVIDTQEQTAISKSGEVFTRITPHFPAKMLGVGNPPMKGK